MNLSIVLSISLLIISFFLTWIYKNISTRRNIMDIPNERSSHSYPIPRGGGVAIVLSWHAGIFILFILNMMDSNLYYALLSGVLLAIISLIDDMISLKPAIRLAVQLISVLIAFYFLWSINPVLFFNTELVPKLIIYLILIVGMVWFINLFNFLDGIDGYASIEAISMALAFFIFTGQSFNLLLIASVMGFLIWNWPKAKIFMGDVGSTQLGFIIIVLAIYFHIENQFHILSWLVISAPFWFDATITLFRRWRNKEALSQAHRKHVYQRLVQSGFSHLEVDLCLIVLNVILFVLVAISLKYSVLQLPLLFLVSVLMYLTVLYTDKKKPF